MEPGTKVNAHRHPDTDETYIHLRGRSKVLFWKEDGSLDKESLLDAREGNYGIHIPAGQWHSLEVLEENTVIFEVKDGPYVPITPQDLL